MIIKIISDVHGSTYWFNKALKDNNKNDLLLCLGDLLYHGPRNPFPRDYSPSSVANMVKHLNNIIIVKGNCDSNVDETVTEKVFENKAFIFADGIKIIAVHGDEVQDYKKLSEIYSQYDIILFGHIHIPVLEKMGNSILFNPGSVSLPKDNSNNSFGILDTENRILKVLDFSNKIIKETTF